MEKIRHRGATNLCGGLLKGMEQIILRGSEQKAKVSSDEIIAAMSDPVGLLAKSGVLHTHATFLPTLQQ